MSALLTVGFIPTAALADDAALSEQEATVDAVVETTDAETTEADITLDTTLDEVGDPVESATSTEEEINPTPEYTESDPSLETDQDETTTPVNENTSPELGIEYPLPPENSSDNVTISVVEELPTEVFLDEPNLTSTLTNEELFNGDIEKTLGDVGYSTLFSDTANSSSAGYDYLPTFGKYLYQELKSTIQDIAAGRRSTTDFEIDIYDAILKEFPKLSQELTDDEYWELWSEIHNYVQSAFRRTFDALVLDCPFEFYWMQPGALSMGGARIEFSAISNQGIRTITGVTAKRTSLAVDERYAAKNNFGDFESFLVDTSKTQAASQIAARAQAVVDKYSSLPDYEKLVAYKDWICDNVVYNYDAYDSAINQWVTYNDAWQIINVFDGDPNTNVVCDGYAKAFQYLCDLSTFQNPTTKCYMVVGWVNRRYHAWNVVTLANARGPANYLVDITWTDSSDGDWQVFLNGAKSGNIDIGYTFENSFGSTATYTYTDSVMAGGRDTVDFYGTDASSILNLSFEDYIERPKPSDPVEPSKPDNNQNSANNPSKPSSNNQSTIKTGWVQSGNTWYYYNSNGTMLKGWQLIGGVWYYLGSNGAMATGWTNVSGAWYYLNGSGAMQTGWQQIGGAWYYLNPSGAMATGWTNIGGTWYYLKSSGAMATGWQQIGGAWYYLNGSGAMQTGWYKVGSNWYYSNASGAMQSNRWIGNYYVGSSGAMATSQWVGNYYVDANGLWVR